MSFIPTNGDAAPTQANSTKDLFANDKGEPPSCSQPPVFLLGRDSRGRWVVQNTTATCGGLFVDRTQAIRFIRFEGGNRALVNVVGVLELNFPRQPHARRGADADVARLAA